MRYDEYNPIELSSYIKAAMWLYLLYEAVYSLGNRSAGLAKKWIALENYPIGVLRSFCVNMVFNGNDLLLNFSIMNVIKK